MICRTKRFLFFLLFFVSCQQSFSQPNRAIDSLKRAMKIATDDTSRVRILNILSNQFLRKAQYDEAFQNANEALTLATKKNLKRGMAAAYNSIGSINSDLGKYKEAMENFRISLAIRVEIKDTSGIAATYSNIGEVYSRLGNYPQAMDNILLSLRLAEKINDKKRIALCYEQRGIISGRQKKLPEALKDHQEALRIRKEIPDRPGIASSLTNLGLIYGMLDNDEKALECHFIALKIKQDLGEKKEIAVCYQNIGLTYAKQGRLSEALENFMNSLNINKEISDKRSIAFCCNNIGKIYTRLCKYEQAKQYLTDGLLLSKEIGTKGHTMDIYHSLSKLDSAEGNFHQALINYKLYTDYKDSLFNERSNQQINQLKEQYESEKKDKEKLVDEKKINDLLLKRKQDSLTIVKAENDKVQLENERVKTLNLYNQQEITLLNNEKKIQQLQILKDSADYIVQRAKADKAIQQLQLKRQKQAKNYFIAGLVLFAILSFFIYRNYHTRQKLKLLTLRNKIASDLHDDVGSTLSSISIFSQMAQQQSKETIPMLETIGESSRKMLDAMADIVWTIKPENDQFEKIIMRMRSFAYELLGAKKIDFEFIADEEVEKYKLPMEVRRNLYLIFKEATNNMVKYSEARRAMFAIKGEKNNLTMIIKDDGKGFNTESSTAGNGLKNMKQRAKEIGAEFMIDSRPGNGTMIQLKIAV